MKKLNILMLIYWTINSLSAQTDLNTPYWGVKFGVDVSRIQNVDNTIIPNWHPIDTYTAEANYVLSGVGTLFFYNRFTDNLAVQGEVSLSSFTNKKAGHLAYEDTVGLNYQMTFNYSYLSFTPHFKYYPAGTASGAVAAGLSASLGVNFGLNAANTDMVYRSNKPELGPDLQIQENLSSVLKGNSILVSPVFSLGLEIPVGEVFVVFDARFAISVNDTFKTLANGYNFIEEKNIRKSFGVSLGLIW